MTAAGAVRSILLVDDDADLREELASFLQAAGYAVQQAHNGEAALFLLRSQRPDLIVTDVMMPGEDGIGLLRQRAALGVSCPVIVMTGGSRSMPGLDVTNIARMMMADAVFAKPFEANAMLIEIERLLSH